MVDQTNFQEPLSMISRSDDGFSRVRRELPPVRVKSLPEVAGKLARKGILRLITRVNELFDFLIEKTESFSSKSRAEEQNARIRAENCLAVESAPPRNKSLIIECLNKEKNNNNTYASMISHFIPHIFLGQHTNGAKLVLKSCLKTLENHEIPTSSPTNTTSEAAVMPPKFWKGKLDIGTKEEHQDFLDRIPTMKRSKKAALSLLELMQDTTFYETVKQALINLTPHNEYADLILKNEQNLQENPRVFIYLLRQCIRLLP